MIGMARSVAMYDILFYGSVIVFISAYTHAG